VKITRLRLLGFKSFAEPAEIDIHKGLTGVVGPNGCGKSNLLEALRWAMGETSHKSMRGNAMDDVIFSGAQNRPARNTAEVTLFVDNSARLAPAEFNDADTLEITRRIEREAGSAYRVNGKDVRARDLRLLFEDAATGARSPALVRQGRIGEIVSAAPQERRRILEDAAGIAGLHSRRHEAELRLKAAESNLERLGDIIGELANQLQALKRQARQAQRYREISGKIREVEALEHHLRWVTACTHVDDEEAAFQSALANVAMETQSESEALRMQAEAAEKLQPLRAEESTRAAALHRLGAEREALEREEARAKTRQTELETRLAQALGDREREHEQIAEASAQLRQLEEEAKRLTDLSAEEDVEPQLRAAAAETAAALAHAEGALSAATEDLARARAEQRRIETEKTALEARIAKNESQLSDVGEELTRLETGDRASALLSSFHGELERLTQVAGALEAELLNGEAGEEQAHLAAMEKRNAAAQAVLHAQELHTELATLLKLLRPEGGSGTRPIAEDVRIEPGYQRALGAALGEDLEAASEEHAPAFWRPFDIDTADYALPEGALPLSRFVSGPEVLARRLGQIGIVAREIGDELQTRLKPGQRLVSKEGDLWRWDGYRASPEATKASAARLVERGRLEELKREASQAEARAIAENGAAGTAAEQARAAADATRNLRLKAREVRSELDRTRDEIAALEHQNLEQSKQIGALSEAKTRTLSMLDESRSALERTLSAQLELAALAGLEDGLERTRRHAGECRSAHARAEAALEGFEREAQLRQIRQKEISAAKGVWDNRVAKANDQLSVLEAREAETRTDLAELANLPAEIEERRRRLLDALSEAEAERTKAANDVAFAEAELKSRDKSLREAQERLSGARESRARIEARLESARERRSETAHAISEHLGCAPEACLEIARLKPGSPLPSLAEAEARVAKLKGDRERLGGVNLRAEEEEAELQSRLDELQREKADVEQAIARLRQGISNLNREGRKRLLEAFDSVNAHFQRLFQTLFAGGSAELRLVESDDPLQSGLDILACPPGKRLQTLTLLSGGEKALTALALIFAVFLTNPSPICVLDEVDAPLDDSNVERFCQMMEEMARETETRFLIITHHPLTMSRMSRLFGVTMAERGVSQLVSVDLETAEQLRDAS
jgi:chromosome segregation protein